MHPSKAALSCADQAVHAAHSHSPGLIAGIQPPGVSSFYPPHPSIPCGAQYIPVIIAHQCCLKHSRSSHVAIHVRRSQLKEDKGLLKKESKIKSQRARRESTHSRRQAIGEEKGVGGSLSRMKHDPVSSHMNVR